MNEFILELCISANEQKTPDEVMLERFEIGRKDDLDAYWRLVSHDGSWTPRANCYLSDILSWLYQNGYKPVPGTDPTLFRRARFPATQS